MELNRSPVVKNVFGQSSRQSKQTSEAVLNKNQNVKRTSIINHFFPNEPPAIPLVRKSSIKQHDPENRNLFYL